MQPIGTFQQVIRLGGRASTLEHVTYILATGFEDSPFPAFYQRAKASGWRTLTMPCGHDMMLDRPEDLTGALLDIAAARSPSTRKDRNDRKRRDGAGPRAS